MSLSGVPAPLVLVLQGPGSHLSPEPLGWLLLVLPVWEECDGKLRTLDANETL